MSAIYKKVVISGLVVLIAFVITIGSTFAWFTVGQAGVVEDMTLTINSSESILILMDDEYDYQDPTDKAFLDTPTNYKSVLTNSDITSVYDYTSGKVMMQPVTSTNGLSIVNRAGAPALFAPKDDAATPDPIPAGAYLEFSVWLFSQSADASIAVSNMSLSAANTVPDKNIVVNALRLSLDAGAANTGTKRIFGLNKDYDFEFLENQVGFNESDSDANIIDPLVEASLIANNHAVFHTTGAALAGQSVIEKADATGVFDLVANTPTKVTIRIWIEGWDAQANNNLIGATFSLAFSFIVKPEA